MRIIGVLSLLLLSLVFLSPITYSDGKRYVTVYKEYLSFSIGRDQEHILIHELRLRVIDRETNESIDRGVVNLYLAMWYPRISYWFICRVDSGIVSNGSIVFSGEYGCEELVGNESIVNSIYTVLHKVNASANATYIVYGYIDPLGEYVSEPDPNAYFVETGLTLIYLIHLPKPLNEPIHPLILLAILIFSLIYSIRRNTCR